MLKATKPIQQIFEPLPLRVGLGMFIIIQFLGSGPLNGIEENILLQNIFAGALGLSFLLVGIGAGMVVIRNEKMRLQTREAKMRRYYLYLVIVLVAGTIILPFIDYFMKR